MTRADKARAFAIARGEAVEAAAAVEVEVIVWSSLAHESRAQRDATSTSRSRIGRFTDSRY